MKKINIGVVLIILSIISFVIVVVLDAKKQKEEVEKAREFASEFLEVMEKYILLPEEYRDINKVMKKEEYEKYISKMREEIGKYMLDGEKDYLLGEYERTLLHQYEGSFIIKNYNIEIEFTEHIDSGDYKSSKSKVGDIIKIYFNENMESVIERRVTNIKDTVSDRYIGETHEEKRSQVTKQIMVIKKVSSSEYKVVWYYMMF